MMRRSSVKLVLASTLPLALAGCGPSESKQNFEAKANFKSVQECVEAKVPVDVCSDAYMQALSDHRRIAPTYDDKASCDADFVPDYCQVTSDGKYVPKMGGFELGFSGQVPKEALDRANQEVTQSAPAGMSGTTGLMAGLLIGNLLSNGFGGNRYSQPIYQTRDDRGGYYSSSLPSQIDRGKTFSRSTQAQSSPDRSYGKSTLGLNLGSSGSGSSSVSSTISRGGFGSQASARSGWGGKSSGSSSFGG
ncbi:putative lipoprotein [Pseudomonas coronafaciens pv. atropurpurea]|nr:putative lipoprotein [Pseudomonas coronafaciens pv. atropurpurea]